MSFTLLIGGSRCGKSSLAVQRACAWADTCNESSVDPGHEHHLVFVATGSAGDDEMTRRIAAHREERDGRWTTVEAPDDLVAGVASALAIGPRSLVLIDCLSFWVANRLMGVDDNSVAWAATEERLTAEMRTVADMLAHGSAPSIVVTNEVGSGVVPDNALGRQFRDTLGRINAIASRAANDALLVVAGRTLRLERA